MKRGALTDCIEHKGQIIHIKNNRAFVAIDQETACESCHAKSFCSVQGSKKKIIETQIGQLDYQTGDKVNVKLKSSLGVHALLLGYILPLSFVLITLLISGLLIGNELIAGLLSLFVLVPYFLILSLFKNKMKKKYSFNIEPV